MKNMKVSVVQLILELVIQAIIFQNAHNCGEISVSTVY